MQSMLVYVPEVHGCNKITSSSHPLWRKNRKRASSALPSRQSSVVSRQRQASEAESEADAEADKSPKPRTENHFAPFASSSSSSSFFFLDFFSSTHLACICICICKNVTTFAYDSHVVRSGQVRCQVTG